MGDKIFENQYLSKKAKQKKRMNNHDNYSEDYISVNNKS